MEPIETNIDADDVAQLYIDRPDCQKLIDVTIDHTLSILAAQLNVSDFTAGDGSEDFWGDVGNTVGNILQQVPALSTNATPPTPGIVVGMDLAKTDSISVELTHVPLQQWYTVKHKAGQYDSIVREFKVADDGKYRIDTIGKILTQLRTLRAVTDDRDRLKSIVDTFQKSTDIKTADGVTIVAGMKLYPLEPMSHEELGVEEDDYTVVFLSATDRFSGDTIDSEDLPLNYSSKEAAALARGETGKAIKSKNSLANHKLVDLEKQAILETLAANNGKRAKTAEILGIGIRTLGIKLKQYSNAGSSRNASNW